jgi:hypothetical protein
LDLNHASGGDHPLKKLLGLGRATAQQTRRQPAVATVGDHRQGQFEIHVEADFAGQAIEVEEIDADPQGIFNAISSQKACDQLAGRGLEIVGQTEGGLITAQSRHRQLPERIGIAAELDDFIEITNVLVMTLGNVVDGTPPGVGRQGIEATEDGRSPASDGDKPDLALAELDQF